MSTDSPALQNNISTVQLRETKKVYNELIIKGSVLAEDNGVKKKIELAENSESQAPQMQLVENGILADKKNIIDLEECDEKVTMLQMLHGDYQTNRVICCCNKEKEKLKKILKETNIIVAKSWDFLEDANNSDKIIVFNIPSSRIPKGNKMPLYFLLVSGAASMFLYNKYVLGENALYLNNSIPDDNWINEIEERLKKAKETEKKLRASQPDDFYNEPIHKPYNNYDRGGWG